MNPLVDVREREVIRTSLDETLIVEAAAGTGKTTELAQRLVNVLADGRGEVDSVVAVTFTEKAAGELKLRLRAGLEVARRDAVAESPQRAHLDKALAHLEEAHINTIHGFCNELLHERPVEAAVDPQFSVLTDGERLYRQAFDLWLQETLEDPPEGVRRSLRRRTRRDADGGPVERLRAAGWKLIEWRDFTTPWRRPPFDRRGEIDRVVARVHAVAELSARASNAGDFLFRDTGEIRRLSADVRAAETVRPRDHDDLEARLIALAEDRWARPRTGRGAMYAVGLPREEMRAAVDDLFAELETFKRDADADLAALLQDELMEAAQRYERLKARTGALDFLDLLLRTRDLLRDSDEVRAHFQRRFTHVFVDEFQDTDPLQAEILLLLTAADATVRDWRATVPAPGKLFVVGDPKQSIYRFRRADVATYQEVKALLVKGGARWLHLVTSFRGVPTIQRVINAAFAPPMREDPERLQPGYVALARFRSDLETQPAAVVLPVPKPYGRDSFTKMAIDASLPDAVGAFVHWLLTKSGWTVTERESGDRRVPVAARHVCLLFRRFETWGTDVTRPFVEALEARGVPHLLVGGKSFHRREEVENVRAALSAVEWPDDELSVFATLRGPLFAIDDETLLAYRHRYRRLHPFRLPVAVRGAAEGEPREKNPDDRVGDGGTRLSAGEPRDESEIFAPIVDALSLLQRLHRRRNRRPLADTVDDLLVATRAHAGLVLRPWGEQALANVLHLSELARAYEAGGGISFRGFVERLREDADGGDAPEAPILEDGSEGVRLMTVHKAKGLEFPVVVLADITAAIARQQASHHVDGARGLCALSIAGWTPHDLLDHQDEELARDRAEGVRVAYVAATRARDVLVIPAVGDDPFAEEWSGATDGWVSPVHEAIYPAAEIRRQAAAAAGCPAFGGDSVYERLDGRGPGPGNVRPGRHHFAAGAQPYDVVWWDPGVLSLGVQPTFGIRRQEIIESGNATDVEAGRRAYEHWRDERQALLARASAPMLLTETVTEWAHRRAEASSSVTPDVLVDEGAGPDAAAVTVLHVDRGAPSPGGARYGALVHAVLATVPLDADRPAVDDVAALHGRILGATRDEVVAAGSAVTAALAHPLLQRARAAADHGHCRRETPITLTMADGRLLEGVVDLAFADDDGWTVVDFKTDRELDGRVQRYRRQVALYAAAVARATSTRASAVLLTV